MSTDFNVGAGVHASGSGGNTSKPRSWLSRFLRVVCWTLVVVFCMAVGGSILFVAWMQVNPHYTATSLLRIARKQPSVLFPSGHQEDLSDFEVYKDTQAEILKSRFVLLAALRDEKFKELPTIQREDRKHQAIEWLRDNLRVQFSNKNTEIMQVSLTLYDPKEAAEIVNAVVRAYFEESVDRERKARSMNLSNMDRKYAEKHEDVRKLRAELKAMEDQLGVASSPQTSIRQQIAIGQVLEAYRAWLALKNDLQWTRAELRFQQAWAAEDNAAQQSAPLDSGQPAKATKAKADESSVPGKSDPRAAKAEIARLQARTEVLEQMVDSGQKDLEVQRRQAEMFDRRSPDMEMMRAELLTCEQVLNAIAWERERLRTEIDAPPRVMVVQTADVPENPD